MDSISDTGSFLCVWGLDLLLKVIYEIWTCLGVHSTVMLSELFLCIKRSEMKRSQVWHRSNRQGVLISM